MEKNKHQSARPPKSAAALILIGTMIMVAALQNTGGSYQIAVFVILTAIVTFTFVFLIAAKKAKGSTDSAAVRQKLNRLGFVTGDQPEHSHDRLSVNNTAQVCDEDSYTHWKKQLDDFLEAGIIERSEYKALLERYRTEK